MKSYNNFKECLEKSKSYQHLTIVTITDEVPIKEEREPLFDKYTHARRRKRVLLVWNSSTHRLSAKTLETNSKGDYIKSDGRNYYLYQFE